MLYCTCSSVKLPCHFALLASKTHSWALYLIQKIFWRGSVGGQQTGVSLLSKPQRKSMQVFDIHSICISFGHPTCIDLQ